MPVDDILFFFLRTSDTAYDRGTCQHFAADAAFPVKPPYLRDTLERTFEADGGEVVNECACNFVILEDDVCKFNHTFYGVEGVLECADPPELRFNPNVVARAHDDPTAICCST